MKMGAILAILQWAIPSGGIGAAIAWLADRKVARAKAAKEVQDIYESMYDRVSKLLIETQKKNEEIQGKLEKMSTESAGLKRAINRLNRAIEAIQLCPHRGSCPVSSELSIDEDADGDDKNGHDSGDKDRSTDDQTGHDKPAVDASNVAKSAG